MSNLSSLLNPTAIIYINRDLSDSVLETIKLQMSITQVFTDPNVFDDLVYADAYYVADVHAMGERILVLRDLQDQTNRSVADIVLFYKNGLVTVESNKVGPPNISLSLSRVYLWELIKLSARQFDCVKRTCCPCSKSVERPCKCPYSCSCWKVFCRYPFS